MEIFEHIKNLHPLELAGMIIAVIGLVLFLYNLRISILANSSKNWLKTSGEILESELNVFHNTGEADKVYNPKVKYKYILNGKEYISTRIYFGNKVASSFKKRKSLRVIDSYPKGKTVDVYYNPMKESLCVLEPGIKSEIVSLVLIGLVFFLGGYFILTNIDLVIQFINK